MKYQKKDSRMALWLVILLDALLLGVILLTFAAFHHVLPRMWAQYAPEAETEIPTESVETQPVETVPPVTEPDTIMVTDPVTEPDYRTEWQIKFEDRFTQDVVWTDHSYTSQEISITIDTVETSIDDKKVTYYVADVYVAGMENFKTRLANDRFSYYGAQEPTALSKAAGAILAINGDYATVHKTGFVVRNSQVYLSDLSRGICAIFPDGTMETYDQGKYEVGDILARNPVHVWSFGPSLLDENGKALEEFNLAKGISGRHPRCAIGYYEPGHYCFIQVDGRQNGYSNGISMPNLAKIFEELGCKVAYNLDGGQSSVMMFDHVFYSKPYKGGRDLGDILYIAESGLYTQNVELADKEEEQ